MASSSSSRHVSYDLLIDVDLTDDSEIRAVVGQITSFLGVKEGVRLSVLPTEEWMEALWRSLSPALRRGAERHIHVLRDKSDPHHLLVSSSAVAGLSEGSRVIYGEVVYAVLRCLPTDLSTPLRRGLDDLLAQWIGEILQVDIFARNFPEESELVRCLVKVLDSQFQSFGHRSVDWAKLLRSEPDRFFYALERSRFASVWLALAKRSELAPWLADEDKTKPRLIELLRAETLSVSDPLVALTKLAAQDFLELQAEGVPPDSSAVIPKVKAKAKTAVAKKTSAKGQKGKSRND